MMRIKITGWSEGFDTIGLSHFLMRKCGHRLTASKDLMEQVLHGKTIEISAEEFTDADLDELNSISVRFEVMKIID